ncbi:MAG: YdcF family protein [Caulobacteraceae bacterium]
MSWFFPASKALAFVAAPSHILLWLVFGAAAALTLGRIRAGRVLGVVAAALFVLIGVAPLGSVLTRPLEDRYPRPPLPRQITGIVTLGGGLGVPALMARGAPGSAPSRDRLVSTYELARLHPEARVVFSGGWGQYSDAIAARDDFLRMGLAPARLVLEGRSRNTYENLAFTQALVRPRPGETWVLATSAIQLPRAMAVARRVGWPMIPWPTDYKTDKRPFWREGGWFQIGDNLSQVDDAAHEWIGLAVYGATGLAGKRSPSGPGAPSSRP